MPRSSGLAALMYAPLQCAACEGSVERSGLCVPSPDQQTEEWKGGFLMGIIGLLVVIILVILLLRLL